MRVYDALVGYTKELAENAARLGGAAGEVLLEECAAKVGCAPDVLAGVWGSGEPAYGRQMCATHRHQQGGDVSACRSQENDQIRWYAGTLLCSKAGAGRSKVECYAEVHHTGCQQPGVSCAAHALPGALCSSA